MRLSELEPHWIHPNVFIFKCPHCRKVWLTCKNIQTTRQEIWDILKAGLGEDWNEVVVPPKPECSWTIERTVPADPKAAFMQDCSVSPSIDASASGHWHGFIKNGEIQ